MNATGFEVSAATTLFNHRIGALNDNYHDESKLELLGSMQAMANATNPPLQQTIACYIESKLVQIETEKRIRDTRLWSDAGMDHLSKLPRLDSVITAPNSAWRWC